MMTHNDNAAFETILLFSYRLNLLQQPMDVKRMLGNMILDGPFQNPSKIFNLQLDDVALL